MLSNSVTSLSCYCKGDELKVKNGPHTLKNLLTRPNIFGYFTYSRTWANQGSNGMLRHAFGTLGDHKYINMIIFGCRSEHQNESAEMLKTRVPKLTNITLSVLFISMLRC